MDSLTGRHTKKLGPLEARRCTGNRVPQPEAVDLDMSQNWLVALSSTRPRDCCDPFKPSIDHY